MKKTLKIIAIILGSILLVAYLLVAILCSWIGQTAIGSIASSYFTKEWGGTVDISAIRVNPFGSVDLYGIKLVDPDDDTIFLCQQLSVHYTGMPIDDEGLRLNSVKLRNTYFHLKTDDSAQINLKYIIDYFASNSEPDTTSHETTHFIVRAKQLILDNVEYRMDLNSGSQTPILEHSVNYQHQHYYNINAKINDIRVDADDIHCHIERFAARERSGFNLRNLTCDAAVSPYGITADNLELTTDNTTLKFDASMTYDTWDGLSDYCNDVHHNLILKEGCVVGMKDVGHWVPLLWGVRDSVRICGRAEGPVAALVVDSIGVDIIDRLSLGVQGTITGLPDIANTVMRISVNDLVTSYASLTQIALPEKVDFHLPQMLSALGNIHSQITLDGSQQHCDAKIAIATDICRLESDLEVRYDNSHNEYYASCNLSTPEIKISSVLPNEWVSTSGLRSSIKCHGTSYSDLSGTMDGELYNTVLRGVPINSSTIKSNLSHDRIDFDIAIDDPLLAVNLSGGIMADTSGNRITVNASVENCDAARLHLLESDSSLAFATHLRVNAVGSSLQEMTGNASLNNTKITFGDKTIRLNNIFLSIDELRQQRELHLTSDWVNGTVSGYFNYTDFGLIAHQFCDKYLPTYYNPWLGKTLTDTITDASLAIDLTWHGGYDQLQQLGSSISIARGTTLNATYNQSMDLRLVLRSDSIAIGGFGMKDVVLIGNAYGDSYRLEGGSERLCIGNPSLLEEVALAIDLASYETHINMQSGNTGNMKNALLNLVLLSNEDGNSILLTEGGFDVAQKRWSLERETITLRRGVLKIPYLMAKDHSNEAEAYNNGEPLQFFTINVDIDKEDDKDDVVIANLRDISLKWISNQWLHGSGFDIDGRITADVTITGLNETPYIKAKLDVNDCKVNQYNLGHLNLTSDGNTESGLMTIGLTTQTLYNGESFSPLSIDGTIDINGTPSVDAVCNFDHFPLKMAAPLLSSFASKFDGMLHGELYVKGPFTAPSLQGSAIVENGLLGIEITGVDYRFSDTLFLKDKSVTLHQFEMYDPSSNILNINGTINYEALHEANLDINFSTPNFMLFNRQQNNDTISGTLYASLDGTLSGNTSNINLSTKAVTQRNSSISVPIDDRREVSESNYVEFIVPTEFANVQTKKTERRATNSALSLNLELDITPDLTLILPMRFQQVAPKLTANGTGKFLLTMNNGNQPIINGNYELANGVLDVDLMSLKHFLFVLDEGSEIRVPGDINNTRFNISAASSTHANLASLMGDAIEGSARSIKIENVILLTGTLNEPNIKFDLRLPQSDKSVGDEIWAYIDRDNEREMFSQSLSLLLTGRFINNSSSSGAMDNASAGGVNLMTSTISGMLNNAINGAIDINIGYQGETELTTEQLDIDLRKEWNRLYVESTLGYGGETRTLKTNDAKTNIVGDVLVGYKINPRLHLFAFNRTNTNDFTRAELPYRQGMGLKLTREFNNWGDFFRRNTSSTND